MRGVLSNLFKRVDEDAPVKRQTLHSKGLTEGSSGEKRLKRQESKLSKDRGLAASGFNGGPDDRMDAKSKTQYIDKDMGKVHVKRASKQRDSLKRIKAKKLNEGSAGTKRLIRKIGSKKITFDKGLKPTMYKLDSKIKDSDNRRGKTRSAKEGLSRDRVELERRQSQKSASKQVGRKKDKWRTNVGEKKARKEGLDDKSFDANKRGRSEQ